MSTVIAWLIFFVIIGWILVGIFAQVWEDAKEIGADEQRKQDFRELNRWKQKAAHPILHIKDTDGKESTEFILRR